MDYKQDLFLCEAIGQVSAPYSGRMPVTHGLCILALENTIVSMKKHFCFSRDEYVLRHPNTDGVFESVVAVGVANIGQVDCLPLKDYVCVVTKIKKSAIRISPRPASVL